MRPSSRPSALTVMSPLRAASKRLTAGICSSTDFVFSSGLATAWGERTLALDLSSESPAKVWLKERQPTTPITRTERML